MVNLLANNCLLPFSRHTLAFILRSVFDQRFNVSPMFTVLLALFCRAMRFNQKHQNRGRQNQNNELKDTTTHCKYRTQGNCRLWFFVRLSAPKTHHISHIWTVAALLVWTSAALLLQARFSYVECIVWTFFVSQGEIMNYPSMASGALYISSLPNLHNFTIL